MQVMLDPRHPINRSMVNWWPLQESGGTVARDIGFVRRNGTFSGLVGRGSGPPGSYGAASYLSRQQIGLAPTINGQWIEAAPAGTVSGNYTVSFWFNATSLGGVLFSTRQPNDYGLDIQLNSIGFHGDIGYGSNWATTIADATFYPSTGVWYRCAYVVTPTTYTIYVNRSRSASGSFSSVTPVLYDASHTVQIGTLQGISGLGFPGRIANVRLWSRALSSGEIAALYDSPWLGALLQRDPPRSSIVLYSIQQTWLSPSEPLVSIQQTRQSVTERLSAAVSGTALSGEYSEGLLLTSQQPSERLSPALITALSPMETVSSAISQRLLPAEWISSRLRDISLPAEWLTSLSADLVTPTERSTSEDHHHSAPLEDLSSITISSSSPLETGGEVRGGSLSPIETSASLTKDQLSPLMYSVSLSVTLTLATERVSAADRSVSLGSEWASAIRADTQIPIDWYVETVSVEQTSSSPVEWRLARADDHLLSSEISSGVVETLSLPIQLSYRTSMWIQPGPGCWTVLAREVTMTLLSPDITMSAELP